MKIIYLGTPEFAVAPLKALLDNNHEILAVVTAPDKPAGRGRKLRMSAVKEFAIDNNIKVLQPTNLKAEEFISNLKDLNADLNIVVAFRMLPKQIWNMPKLGTFNLHASLLPQYRGAAPINWAIINGEKTTGLTTFFLDEKIDTGKIILQKEIEIKSSYNVGDLHDLMMEKGAELIVETVKQIENNTISPIPQSKLTPNEENLKPAPKLFKENMLIDWTLCGNTIINLIRGLSPYPAAFSNIYTDNFESSFKVYDAEFVPLNHNYSFGEIITDKRKEFNIACKDGLIKILDIQLQGKKRMDIKSFLTGYKITKASAL